MRLKGYLRSKVLEREEVGQGSFRLRFTREGISFSSGQCLSVAPMCGSESREYSIYSGQQDPYLEILVRKVPGGKISKHLCSLEAGDELQFTGPCGFFLLNISKHFKDSSHLFVATGTGIAPFRSLLRSYPEFPYRLLYGASEVNRICLGTEFSKNFVTCCLSQERTSEHFYGRVTDYFTSHGVPTNARVSLCGNAQMIIDVRKILTSHAIASSNIETEVYY